jgi:hypothetical protein
MALSIVAVVAEGLEAFRESLLHQPPVEVSPTYLSAVLVTTALLVIDDEKDLLLLSTTAAVGAVRRQYRRSLPLPTALTAGSPIDQHVCPVVLPPDALSLLSALLALTRVLIERSCATALALAIPRTKR